MVKRKQIFVYHMTEIYNNITVQLDRELLYHLEQKFWHWQWTKIKGSIWSEIQRETE